MAYRTDRHNNPTAFTTAIARQAKLVEGVDYEVGDPFDGGITARLLGDPVEITIRVIDRIGFRTRQGGPRWVYINMPQFVWDSLTLPIRRRVVGDMYEHEGGTEMKGLFS